MILLYGWRTGDKSEKYVLYIKVNKETNMKSRIKALDNQSVSVERINIEDKQVSLSLILVMK